MNKMLFTAGMVLALGAGGVSATTLNLGGVTINSVPADADGKGTLTGSVGGTAYFTRADVQTSGTGVLTPFMAIQANGTEEGYNTDGTLRFDTKLQNFTRDIQLNQLAVVNVDGVNYYEFLLDANQNANDTSGKAVISIDQIKIFTSPTASLSPMNINGLGVLRFDLGANNVFIDAGIGATVGSGSADLLAFIPTSAFNGAGANDYLYFYNKNGVELESNDGFEEWTALTGSNNVPDGGATVMLLGAALVGVNLLRRKLS